MLYRLDFHPDGVAVHDPLLGGDYLARHMSTARAYAAVAAGEERRDVLVTRIGKGGHLKATLIIHPDGSASRPPGSKPVSERDDCKKGSGQTCFCSPCRAARRG